MGQSLAQYRDHCARMAVAEHKPECPMLTWRRPYFAMWSSVFDAAGEVEALAWNGPPPKSERPTCEGCNTADDRALFTALAAEMTMRLDSRAALQEAQQPNLGRDEGNE